MVLKFNLNQTFPFKGGAHSDFLKLRKFYWDSLLLVRRIRIKDKLKIRNWAQDEFEVLNLNESSDAFVSREKRGNFKVLSFEWFRGTIQGNRVILALIIQYIKRATSSEEETESNSRDDSQINIALHEESGFVFDLAQFEAGLRQLTQRCVNFERQEHHQASKRLFKSIEGF